MNFLKSMCLISVISIGVGVVLTSPWCRRVLYWRLPTVGSVLYVFTSDEKTPLQQEYAVKSLRVRDIRHCLENPGVSDESKIRLREYLVSELAELEKISHRTADEANRLREL